jgi:hypothetical protein
VRELALADPAMACAAVRCLVDAGGAGRITRPGFLRRMQSGDDCVRLWAVVVATRLVIDGRELPEAVLEIAEQMAADPRAATLVVVMVRTQGRLT